MVSKEVIISEKNNGSAYNTDNIGHLFVTVFEHSAFYNMTLINHHPDTAPVLPIKFLYRDSFLASRQLVPRHCASAHLYIYSRVTANLLSINLVPRHSYTSDNLYLDSKNRAMASLHRDIFLAPLARGIRIVPGCCVGQHKRPIFPGR